MSIRAQYELEQIAIDSDRARQCGFTCTAECHGDLTCRRAEHDAGAAHYDPAAAGGAGVQWVHS